jgi:hypothetical protein
MARINCWEYQKCGRERGGSNAAKLGVCPAATATAVDGLHGGTNGGRVCWAVTGTLCKGEVMGTFAQKAGNCLRCVFFSRVQEEEGSNLLSIQEIHRRLMHNRSQLDNG